MHVADNPRELTVQYDASPTLAEFHAHNGIVRGVMGPVGSGKSTGCCFELFNIACNQRPNKMKVRKTRMLVVRNTAPELKTTTIKTWQAWFPPGDPVKQPGTFGHFTGTQPLTHNLRYSLDDGTRVEMEVIFLAMDVPDDVKKLLSLECTAVWINEAREIPKAVVDGATTRIGRYPALMDGGCSRKALIMDTNPPDDAHWWYIWAEEDTPEGYAFFKQPGGLDPDAENLENLEQPENWEELTLEERRRHGRKYYTDMLSGKDPDYVNVMVNANYGTLVKGASVYEHSFNTDIHIAPTIIPVRQRVSITVGIDSSGRKPAVVYLQPAGETRYEVVRELCIMDKKGMGAEAFTELFVDDFTTHFPHSPIDEIWGDPAGDSPSQNDERTYFDILNKELKKHKLKAKASPGLRYPERQAAVETMLNKLVGGRPMLTISPACKVLCQGFHGKYFFKEKNTAGGGTIVDDRPVKNLWANAQDALQYAACGILYRRKDITGSGSPKKVITVSPRWKLF